MPAEYRRARPVRDDDLPRHPHREQEALAESRIRPMSGLPLHEQPEEAHERKDVGADGLGIASEVDQPAKRHVLSREANPHIAVLIRPIARQYRQLVLRQLLPSAKQHVPDVRRGSAGHGSVSCTSVGRVR